LAKHSAVFVPRIGTLFNQQKTDDDDETYIVTVFSPAKEFAKALQIDRDE
jgi:hypothetical protein